MRTLHLGLKEPNSKSTAADGLATIFLASPEFQGQMTKEWMQDGMSALSDADQKSAVQKVMAKVECQLVFTPCSMDKIYAVGKVWLTIR